MNRRMKQVKKSVQVCVEQYSYEAKRATLNLLLPWLIFKNFSLLLILPKNKLECLSRKSVFRPSLIFTSEARAFQVATILGPMLLNSL